MVSTHTLSRTYASSMNPVYPRHLDMCTARQVLVETGSAQLSMPPTSARIQRHGHASTAAYLVLGEGGSASGKRRVIFVQCGYRETDTNEEDGHESFPGDIYCKTHPKSLLTTCKDREARGYALGLEEIHSLGVATSGSPWAWTECCHGHQAPRNWC